MMDRPRIEPTTHGSGGGVSLRLFCALPVPVEHARTLSSHAKLLAAGDQQLHPGEADAVGAAARSIPGPTGCAIRRADSYGAGRVLALDVDVELHALLDHARDQLLNVVRSYAPGLDQRPWRPHLSLLRAAGDAKLPIVDAPVQQQLARLRWVAGELRLIASLPGPAGPTYRQLHVVPFGKPALRE
jgi:2'-5' RNA ligase